MAASWQWHKWVTASLASAQHHNNTQQYKSFIGRILLSTFKVILTALLVHKIDQNNHKNEN